MSKYEAAVLAARYQNQPWYIKRWRDRYLLRVPYRALRIWWRSGERLSNAYSISKGLCDIERDYWYTMREMRQRDKN